MKRDDLQALRAVLRRGDPAADGSEPTAAELGRIRERILGARPSAGSAEGREPGPWRRSPRRVVAVAAAAALLVLALGVELRLRRAAVDARGPAPGETARSAAQGRAWDASTAGRQVHFTTPGGTRIVWVLYPPREPMDTERDRGRRGPGDLR